MQSLSETLAARVERIKALEAAAAVRTETLAERNKKIETLTARPRQAKIEARSGEREEQADGARRASARSRAPKSPSGTRQASPKRPRTRDSAAANAARERDTLNAKVAGSRIRAGRPQASDIAARDTAAATRRRPGALDPSVQPRLQPVPHRRARTRSRHSARRKQPARRQHGAPREPSATSEIEPLRRCRSARRGPRTPHRRQRRSHPQAARDELRTSPPRAAPSSKPTCTPPKRPSTASKPSCVTRRRSSTSSRARTKSGAARSTTRAHSLAERDSLINRLEGGGGEQRHAAREHPAEHQEVRHVPEAAVTRSRRKARCACRSAWMAILKWCTCSAERRQWAAHPTTICRSTRSSSAATTR